LYAAIFQMLTTKLISIRKNAATSSDVKIMAVFNRLAEIALLHLEKDRFTEILSKNEENLL